MELHIIIVLFDRYNWQPHPGIKRSIVIVINVRLLTSFKMGDFCMQLTYLRFVTTNWPAIKLYMAWGNGPLTGSPLLYEVWTWTIVFNVVDNRMTCTESISHHIVMRNTNIEHIKIYSFELKHKTTKWSGLLNRITYNS